MKFVSVLFHPMLMPTYTFLIVYFYIPEVVKPLGLVTMPFLFATTFLIPLLSISVLRYTSGISSLSMEHREERILPFSFVAIFYGITTYMFTYQVRVNPTVSLMLLSTTILIVVLILITLFEKISIHAAGISGVIGFFVVLGIRYPGGAMLYPLVLGIIASGLVMTSRLYLNVHTPRQILLGTLVGFFLSFGLLYAYG